MNARATLMEGSPSGRAMEMNLLERAIATFAPGFAVKRAANRFRLQLLQRFGYSGYEGAARGRRTENWKASSRDANAEIAPALQVLRNRSRDLKRNNPFAAAAMDAIVDDTVGYGIKPKPKGRTKTITARAAELWKQHAETTAIDYDGKHDIYGLQALALATIVESGAVLVRRHLLTTAQMKKRGAALPFQIQVLEPDLIDLSRDGEQPDGSYDIKGIRYEPNGGIRGYWLYDDHPGSGGLRLKATSTFVPARDVIHTFRMDRPGQVHGVPWSAPVMLRLRNFDEVEDAYIEREKIAACFAVFFSGHDSEIGQTKIELPERLEPGLISFGPPGTTASFANPPGVNGYRDFSWINLHAIAAGFGVPYEVFGDLTGVNFSSGRMGWQKYQRRIDRWQWQMFIPSFCAGVWDWFNSSMQFAGYLNEDCPCVWVPPRRMMVNPKEEIAALKEEIRNGLTTWQQAITERGYDAVEQAEEIAEANKLLDEHGLKLDCDPRFAAPAGSAGVTEKGKDSENEQQEAGESRRE
jgi:lambda family phage portal protein